MSAGFNSLNSSEVSGLDLPRVQISIASMNLPDTNWRSGPLKLNRRSAEFTNHPPSKLNMVRKSPDSV